MKEHSCRSFFYPVHLRQQPLLVQEQHLGILPEMPEDLELQQQTSLQTLLRITFDQKESEKIKTRAQDCENLAAISPLNSFIKSCCDLLSLPIYTYCYKYNNSLNYTVDFRMVIQQH